MSRSEYNKAYRWLLECNRRIAEENERTGDKAKIRNRKLRRMAEEKCNLKWKAALAKAKANHQPVPKGDKPLDGLPDAARFPRWKEQPR